MNAGTFVKGTGLTGVRVLFVWDSDYPWDVRVEKICDTLVQNSCEVHLVCRNEKRRPSEDCYQGAAIHRIGLPRWVPGWMNSLATFPAFVNPLWFYKIYSLVRRYKIQLIVVRDLPMALAAVWAGRIYGVPVILDMAECYPELIRAVWKFEPPRLVNYIVRNPSFADWVERLTFRMVAHTLVVVEEARDRLIGMGVNRAAITIVGNTPRHDRFLNAAASFPGSLKEHRGKFVLVYVGFVNHSRGLDTIVKALKKLVSHTPNVHLVVVGSGNAVKDLQALVRELQLEAHVSFEGWIDNSLVPSYIASADVCVIPHRKCSHWDNTIPNKLFDYMAAKKPVLGSDVIPMRRILTDTQCGLVYRDDDATDCCQQLVKLLDPTLREKLGAQGVQAVVEKYNWGEDAQKFLLGVKAALPNMRTFVGQVDNH